MVISKILTKFFDSFALFIQTCKVTLISLSVTKCCYYLTVLLTYLAISDVSLSFKLVICLTLFFIRLLFL